MKVLVISAFLIAVSVSHGLHLTGLTSQKLFDASAGMVDKIVSESTKDVSAVANAIKGVVTGKKSSSDSGVVTGAKVSAHFATGPDASGEVTVSAKTSSGLSNILKVPTNLAASVADISKDVLQMPTNFAESVADISNDILKVSTDLKAASDGPADLTTLLKVPADLASSIADISKDVIKVEADFVDSMVVISKDVLKAQADFTDSIADISRDVLQGRADIAESMANITQDIIKMTSDFVTMPNEFSNLTSFIKVPNHIAEAMGDISKDLLKVPTNVATDLKNPRSAFVDSILKNFFDNVRKAIVKSVS